LTTVLTEHVSSAPLVGLITENNLQQRSKYGPYFKKFPPRPKIHENRAVLHLLDNQRHGMTVHGKIVERVVLLVP